jgi:antitoxin HicB
LIQSCYDLAMKQFRYNLIFRPEPEGGFTVTVPALPGCITYGKNLIEAKEMAEDAIKAYLVSLKKHREPIPPSDRDSFFGSIDLDVSIAPHA